MSLFISNHAVIFNLVSIYRDLGWEAATLRDNIEHRVISANHAEAKSYRRDSLYGRKETQSDGYLLVYNFDNKEDKSSFILKVKSEGLDSASHIAESYCTWLRQVSISGRSVGDILYLQAVEHVDNPCFSINVNNSDVEYFNHFKIESAVAKTCLINEDYVDYINKNFFWTAICSVLSLIKTKGSHVNYFTPFKYIFKDDEISNIKIKGQVLPGISKVVPNVELEQVKELDSSPEYLGMFNFELY